MDPLSLVLVVAVVGAGVAAVVWYRKRQVARARVGLRQAETDLLAIDTALETFVRSGNYISGSVRRPLSAKVSQIVESNLPPIAKVVRRARDSQIRGESEAALRRGNELRRILEGHNDQYVKRMMTEHSKLLVDDLKADEAQRNAIVRDDVRNLVIAGAGSGKTRTIVGRVCFLLERHVPPIAVLAVTLPDRATEESMSGRWANGESRTSSSSTMSSTSMKPRPPGPASAGSEAPTILTSLFPRAAPPSNIGVSIKLVRCRSGGRLQRLSTGRAWRGNETSSAAKERC